MCRNSSRDYAEFAELVDTTDPSTAALVLAGMDKYYCGQQRRKQWVATQLVRRLADPRPSDEGNGCGRGLGRSQAALPFSGRGDAGGGEVTLAVDAHDPAAPTVRLASQRNRRRWPPYEKKPVEFWPTAAIRLAVESGDLDVWQRIVVALKRDPYGRTARQVEEVLETAPSYGIGKALTEVLARSRNELEADERAEVARQISRPYRPLRPLRPRVRVPDRGVRRGPRGISGGRRQPVGCADGSDAPALRAVREDEGARARRARTEPSACGPGPTTARCATCCAPPGRSRWSGYRRTRSGPATASTAT